MRHLAPDKNDAGFLCWLNKQPKYFISAPLRVSLFFTLSFFHLLTHISWSPATCVSDMGAEVLCQAT